MSSDSANFDTAMRKILSVSKEELQRRLEAERNAKAEAKITRSRLNGVGVVWQQ